MLSLAALLSGGVAIGLGACGGSDSNAAGVSGVVQGSLYEGAKVCLDENSNGVIDSSETNCATSAADGSYTLPRAGTGPVIASIPAGAKEHVTAGDAGTVVAKAFTLHAPVGTLNLSAQSEQAYQLVQSGTVEADAWTSVGSSFGLTASQLKGKFSALDSSTQSTLHTASQTAVANVAAKAPTAADLANIQNVIVIYAENRSFDNLYGSFPGANGIPTSPVAQLDRDGTTLAQLPAIWGGMSAGTTVDSAGGATSSTITEAQTVGMPNQPYQIDNTKGFYNTGIVVDQTVVTKDMYHRFYNNQMQIGPKGDNSSFVAWADSGGAVMGHYDGSKMRLWDLAKQYTLADNFYQAAFGGSFLNHQYLVCACAPEYPNANTDAAAPVVSAIDTGATGRQGIQGVALTTKPTSAASAITATAAFNADSYLTPQVSINAATGAATYGSTGTWYGINTMQPPFQPSSNASAAADTAHMYADRAKPNTLPAQSGKTIGDLLDAKSVSWAWYSGAWNQAVAGTTAATRSTAVIGAANVNFQYHHQPFNYYTKLDPVTNATYRANHLKDYTDLTAAISNGTLPQVSFYKPQGNLNQHPGYASVKAADDHIAALISTIMNSAYKNNVLIVVTYDENGGQWDHAPVPKGDWVGPGSRVPALIISPFSKKGFVDHTQYDTASILRFLVTWKGLDATQLPGLAMRDNALKANGGKAMGDLTGALAFN